MKKVFVAIMAIVFAGSVFTSCKPYQEEKYVDIKPNETAFLIPMEKGTKEDQSKLKSEEYLEQHKVAAKRVYTPTIWHQTGRGWWAGEWIPSVIVIKVDRAPITREWTGAENTGTSNKREEISVESSNSIGFSIGITSTASIPEEDAAKFLYYYNGKTLEEVMDNNVRSFIQDILTREFGNRELTQCQKQRKDVFDVMREAVIKHFSSRGIRIDNIGAAGEFTYLNSEIQTAINTEFVAEKKRDAANNEVLAAQKYSQAAEAIKAQKNLDADIRIKDALAQAIEDGKLTWPSTLSIVVGGQSTQIPSLIDLYGLKNMNK